LPQGMSSNSGPGFAIFSCRSSRTLIFLSSINGSPLFIRQHLASRSSFLDRVISGGFRIGDWSTSRVLRCNGISHSLSGFLQFKCHAPLDSFRFPRDLSTLLFLVQQSYPLDLILTRCAAISKNNRRDPNSGDRPSSIIGQTNAGTAA
jgi:hypothetical protein